MKNFKDLFHNTNDIIIALVIVMMAAGVIVWRFNVIMKYPQVLASQSSRKQSEETLNSASTLKYGSAFKNGALKKDVSVTINGGGETDVSDLIDKNLFTDYKQFTADVKAQGHDVSEIDAGTYSFKKGASVESVISDLVG
ncbi:hypothetical protein QU661_06650 [Mogibacterium neglectum]|uniref:hypothetical protein n=1 Tax=Mogibacterium neglectum TaxID=114528 RepID=UPI00272DC152|nr:hypothetical protein [Mogibacterium neglectum]WLD75954.1 hypothetical protein QU661_06650 [Mogibacterium neglectum]